MFPSPCRKIAWKQSTRRSSADIFGGAGEAGGEGGSGEGVAVFYAVLGAFKFGEPNDLDGGGVAARVKELLAILWPLGMLADDAVGEALTGREAGEGGLVVAKWGGG